MSEVDHKQGVTRKSYTRRNIKILLGISIFNTLLILGVGMSTISDPVNCYTSILLDGDGTAYSNYHEDRSVAEEEALELANIQAELLAAKKVEVYRCPNACPDKFSAKTTVDIRDTRPQFAPPPGEDTSKWSASSTFGWYMNFSCN